VESGEQLISARSKRGIASRPLRLVVLGMIGRMPLAGVVWQVLHYLEGFRRLGFDVYYVEDTGAWPFNPEANTVTADSTYSIALLDRTMAAHGFAGRWAYRDAARGGVFSGLSESAVRQLYARADLLVNVTASTSLREEHLRVPIRVYLESDPVLPQVEIARGNRDRIELLDTHTHHLSFGENLGAPDCGVPVERVRYLATRQPVVLDWWADSSSATDTACDRFTTIANWRQSGKDLEWNGERYTWSKHHEFLKFIDLPRRTTQPIELALALASVGMADTDGAGSMSEADAETVKLLQSYGWKVVNAMSLSKEPLPYREYIQCSRGEFTVAKDQNVRLRSGWFSDRSACYLAAGRPVITQDTGFGKFLPTGRGLFSFRTVDEIVAALDAITADYAAHSRAAREIAEEYFKAETVLARLLADCGV
jgi:hypothetical protein